MSIKLDFIYAAIGGVLIGLATAILLLFTGKVAGISGVLKRSLIPKKGDFLWRALFILGLVFGGTIFVNFIPEHTALGNIVALPTTLLSGFLVGVGTSIGDGCTSGHGICGISRFSTQILFFISAMVVGMFAVILFEKSQVAISNSDLSGIIAFF
jgi:uncharacterized protein